MSIDDILDGPPDPEATITLAPPPKPGKGHRIKYSSTPVIPTQRDEAGKIARAPRGHVRDARGYVPRKAERDPILIRFIEELGPAEEIRRALAHVGTEKSNRFLAEIIKLESKSGPGAHTIAQAAKRTGVGIDSLSEIWRSYSQSTALLKVISAAPKLADDLVAAASNTRVVCPSCLGEGVLTRKDDSTIECPQCLGSGGTHKAGDASARTHLLEWMGVINQGNKSGVTTTGGVYLSLVLPRMSDAAAKSIEAPTIDVTVKPATVDVK